MSLLLKRNIGATLVLAPDAGSLTDAFSNAIVPFIAGTPSVVTVAEVEVLDPEYPNEEASAVISATLINPPLVIDVSAPFPFNNSQKFVEGGAKGVTARPSALVEWGSGGAVAAAEVDYENGFSFSVPASWLRITARNDRVPSSVFGTGLNNQLGRAVRVGAICGIGTVTKSNSFSAKRTLYEDDFLYDAGPPVGKSNLYLIPPFATNFLVYYQPLNAEDPLPVQILNENGQILYGATFPKSGQQDVPVELASDARYIRVTPASVAAFNHSILRIIFGLAI